MRRIDTVVLVAEDEALVQLDAVEMAQDAGYTVLVASNADEAIALLERRSDIRIVFTDVNMPGSMDGIRLAHVIRNRWPPVRLVVTSGKDTIKESDLPSGGRFIPKPYSGTQLAGLLHEAHAQLSSSS